MSERIEIGIVLLNYCGSADTLACLDSLLRSERPFARLAICDNASPDGSMDQLRSGLAARAATMAACMARHGLATAAAWAETTAAGVEQSDAPPDAWVLLIDNRGNRGFAAGNNVGLRWLQSDPAISHFWLLNSDTEVPPGSLGALQAAIGARPEVDLWGGTVLYHAAPEQVQALCGGRLDRRTLETRHVGAFGHRAGVPHDRAGIAAVEASADYALGACMVASRHWLGHVGLLSETYFLYYEELDWATRGRRAGLRLGYAPDVVVLHKEGASIGTAPGGGSPLSVHHLLRSRVLYARLHVGPAAWPMLLYGAIKQVSRFTLRRRFLLARAALAGFIEGARAPTGATP